MAARSPSQVRFAGLDTLRGVAIVAVLAHNLSILEARSALEKTWNAVAESGWIGVQLFFVLSGFLITGILLDDRERPGFIRAFYYRRSLRIFPLYYLLLASIAVASRFAPEVAIPGKQAPLLGLYLSNWSFIAYGLLPGLGHTWSLAVEEQF